MNATNKTQDAIKIYPKMTIFCPVEQEEKSGRECFCCPNFEGIESDKERKFVYISCAGAQLISLD